MSGEGVMLCVCSACGGQCWDEDRLQRDQDLTEGRLLHQTLQLLEVNAHTEGRAVTIHLKDTFINIYPLPPTLYFTFIVIIPAAVLFLTLIRII